MVSISDSNYDLVDVLSDNIDDLMYILDDSFMCEYVNQTVHLSSIGYSCLSENFIDYVYFPDRKKIIDFLQKIFKTGESVGEFRIKSNDTYRYYEIKGKKFFDKLNNPKIFLISRDISKYKQIESEWMKRTEKLTEITQALPEIRFWKLFQTKGSKNVMQKTREMLDLVIDTIPQYIYWKDTNLNYLGCNHNYALINQLNNTNLIIGKKDSELPWLKNNLNHIREREKHIIKSNKSEYSVESWNIANGKKAWFEVNRIPLHDLEENVIGILSTYHDITDRIISEQKLSQSELKYRSILENIKEGYFEVDLKGNYTFVNNSFTELFGYTENEILGNNYKKFADERNRGKVFQVFNQVYISGKGEKFLQFEFMKKNGELVIMETSVYLKYDSEGNRVGFYGIVHDVTEKYRLEQELKQSEEKYRLIFENVYDLIIIIDHHLKFEFANEQPFFDILGYKLEEIIASSILSVVHPSDRNVALDTLRQGLKNGTAQLELRLKHKKGNWVWIEAKGRSFKDKDGYAKGIIVGRDVTEKKQVEEELKILNKQLEQKITERTRRLKESEEKFRTIAEQTSMGILVIQDGYIKYSNDALSKITEYSSEEINSFSQNEFLKKIYYKDQPLVFEHLKNKLNGKSKSPSHYVCRIVSPLNEIKWVDLHSQLIEYQDKSAILATFIDITDKKIAEQKLIESEEKYRHLFENSPYGIVLLDLKGRIIDINSTTQDLFGYSKGDLIGKNYQDLKVIYPSETKVALRDLNNLIREGDYILQKMKPNITKIYKKDGEIAWVESEISNIKIGHKIFIQIIIQDITDKKIADEKLKESEKKLRKQNIELRELDRLKTDFITITVHELKTPLISVGGFVDLILMREKELKKEIKEDLERSLSNVRRLENYINRLTDVMKIDAKKMELEFENNNLFQILEACLSELHFQINQKNLNLKLDVNKDIQLLTDSFRISQVFSNLISNAIKFSNKGDTIDITAKELEDNYLFIVKDYGKGLSKEEMGKLFGKFISVGQDSEGFSTFERGSGLGLYIAKGIIEAHGGKIGVKSEGFNKGAEFYFTLPKE